MHTIQPPRRVQHPEATHCQLCRAPLHGRSDKRFCTNQCRSEFHNHANHYKTPYIRSVNRILRRNHAILHRILATTSRQTIAKAQLIEAGFRFAYITHIKETQSGMIKYCYDLSYREKGVTVVVIKQERNPMEA